MAEPRQPQRYLGLSGLNGEEEEEEKPATWRYISEAYSRNVGL